MTGSAPAIERGKTYIHDTHGKVEILGIWKGVRRIDEARNIADSDGPMIVCYTIEADGDPVGELTDTLDEFLNAIEPTE